MGELARVSVDVLGGDLGPDTVLSGIEQAVAKDPELSVLACGPADLVDSFASRVERVSAHATTEEISMAEHPATAVRKKKDSSIVVGCRLVRDGEADGFFSAGSTGACLAAATLVMGRVKGIARPALATIVPTPERPVLLCDVGANAECKPEYLLQFGQMASVYLTRVLGVQHPRLALLNIGEEEEKGSRLYQKAHRLMVDGLVGFAGNAEGRDIMAGSFDAVICDGFTGNVCLKTIEGTASVLFKEIKRALTSNARRKLGAALAAGGLRELKGRFDPDAYGGAPLLGVKGACVVGHGSSSARAIENGILATARAVRAGVSELIAQTA